MPDLLEYEAKQLFRRAGIETPAGSLWPEAAEKLTGPAVIKVQVPEGGRGKRGGIRPVPEPATAHVYVERMLAEWPGAPVEAVYMEEQVQVERELYLAVALDRDQRCPVLIAGAEGGIDVEESRPVSIPIHPLGGWPPYAERRLQSALGVRPEVGAKVGEVARKLVAAFHAYEAELMEINPLGLTPDGRLIALDGKVTIDPSARRSLPIALASRQHADPFLERCKELYVNGALCDGDIAMVVSGAGLLMATVDLVTDLGGRPGVLIDLGAALFRDPAYVTETVRMVSGYKPKVMLFNYNLQLAQCDRIAAAIAEAFRKIDPEDWPAVVVRQKGNAAEEGARLLEPFHFTSTTDLDEACRLAVELARGGKA